MKTRYILILLPFLLIGLFIYFLSTSEKTVKYTDPIKVKRGNLTLFLHERGVLKAAKDIHIKSTIQSNRAKLIEIIPEGSKVQKGQIIARFDTKPFMDDLTKEQYKEQEAEVSLIKIKKEIKIHENKSIQSIKKLRKSIEIATLKLNNIKKGDGLNKLKEIKQSVTQEIRNVKLKKEELADYDSLLSKGFISQRERDKVANDLLSAREKLVSVKNKFQNYNQYVWPKEIKEQEIKLSELQEEIQDTQVQNKIILEQKKSQFLKAKALFAFIKKEIKKAKSNIKKCDITAPIDGVVLYQKIPKNGKQVKIEVGDSIWRNQAFINIPDTKNMIVQSKIREVDLSKVKLNQKVSIKLDAFSNKNYNGYISYIDSVAKFGSNNENIKFFNITIVIEQSDVMLRSGMSAEVTIPYKVFKNILKIPSNYVYEKDEKFFVIKKVKEIYKKIPIKIGVITPKYIEVSDGLHKADLIVKP